MHISISIDINDEFGLKLESDIQTNECPYLTHWSWHHKYKTVLFTISVDLKHQNSHPFI